MSYYASCFPCSAANGKFGSAFSAKEQYDLILGRIPAFQVEEANCVHQYFMELSERMLDHIETAFVDDAKKLSLVKSNIPLWSSLCRSRFYWLYKFYLPSAKHCYMHMSSGSYSSPPEHIASHAASRGLDYAYTCLATSDQTLRFTSICKPLDRWRNFLPEAMYHQPNEGHPYPLGIDEDNPRCPNKGWMQFRFDKNGKKWLPRQNRVRTFCVYKDVAFVFWDSWRLEPSSLWSPISMTTHVQSWMKLRRSWPRSILDSSKPRIEIFLPDKEVEMEKLRKKHQPCQSNW